VSLPDDLLFARLAGRERGRESEEEGGRECVCEDLMVKNVANVIILNF
jgi:hypothetical protein